MPLRDGPFAFTKWYADCVDNDGRVAVIYWASLAWHGLSLIWQSVTVYEAGRAPVQRTTLTRDDAPANDNGCIEWRVPALASVLIAEARQPRFERRLFTATSGCVDWCCEAPIAHVTLDIAGHAPIRGTGYVERVTLTTPPWRLPLDELRWGRWISDAADRSLVWIDWRGPEPRRWVFVDGVEASDAAVGDDRVSVGDVALSLERPWTLSSRTLDNTIRLIPVLEAVVPSPLLAWRETKWSSDGIVCRSGEAPSGGRAIHELVVIR